MRLRPEHLDAIRALNGPGNDMRAVVDLLRGDPANIHAEVRLLLAEMLRADSASPRRLYIGGRGGRPPNGFDPEGTRQQWITKLGEVSPLSQDTARAIAAALDPLATGSPYLLKARNRKGRPELAISAEIRRARLAGRKFEEQRRACKGDPYPYETARERAAAKLRTTPRRLKEYLAIYRRIRRFFSE